MTMETPVTELSETEIAALHEALDDEYHAWATYDQVIRDFGEVRPFINILDAEARHISALKEVFKRYRLAVPENSWIGQIPGYGSLYEACAAGVKAEIENDRLYARLLAATQRPDILSVFQNLQEASRERHLPAFQRCVERGWRRSMP
jgi:hypothetical protein